MNEFKYKYVNNICMYLNIILLFLFQFNICKYKYVPISTYKYPKTL